MILRSPISTFLPFVLDCLLLIKLRSMKNRNKNKNDIRGKKQSRRNPDASIKNSSTETTPPPPSKPNQNKKNTTTTTKQAPPQTFPSRCNTGFCKTSQVGKFNFVGTSHRSLHNLLKTHAFFFLCKSNLSVRQRSREVITPSFSKRCSQTL